LNDVIILYTFLHSDADAVLSRETVNFMGKMYEARKPNVDGAVEETIVIKLHNVPSSVNADMLELLLERRLGSPLSPGLDISIDEETHEAIITFADAAGK
jgi:hypothetical protein